MLLAEEPMHKFKVNRPLYQQNEKKYYRTQVIAQDDVCSSGFQNSDVMRLLYKRSWCQFTKEDGLLSTRDLVC